MSYWKSNALNDSAQAWENYFQTCNIKIEELTKMKDWDKELVASYKQDIYNIKKSIFSTTYQTADIKKDSPFYWFQKGAKWHLRHMVNSIINIPELKNTTDAINKYGWSYNNSIANNPDSDIY